MNSLFSLVNPLITNDLDLFTNANNANANANANNSNANANNANANANNANVNKKLTNGILFMVVLTIIFHILPVMLIAANCNPNNPIMYSIIAFLVPNIYLLQYAIRKYLMREKGYCGNK